MSPRRTTRRTTTRADTDAPIEGLPIVALVGRPNVGKSTLFNRVVGERQAVVEDRARTTRDRIYAIAEWNGRRFVIVDTGGLERHPNDQIEEKVQEQAHLAIGESDVIVFLVDADSGEVPADLEAAEILRTATAPILVAANKADNPKREIEAAEFHRLGWEETYAISALHGKGVADLLDAIVWALPAESPAEIERKRAEREAEELVEEAVALGEEVGPSAAELEADGPLRVVRVAIVGRPNVGKSSLLNKLLGEDRAIVSDIPGTTRDAIDTALDWNGTSVRLVDTAGIRRRGKVASGPAAEKFSTLRAVRAVGRADVAVLVVDASEGLTAQDAHVAGYVVEEGTGLVVAINKWDLVEKTGRTFDEYVARIRADTPFLDFAPVIAISALTGQRVGRVLDAALEVAAGRRRRVPTAELNRVLGDAAFRQPAPPVKGRRSKFYYATQVAIEPPTFVLFARDADAVHFSYKRYLENRLRDAFGFGGSPMRLIFRERSQVELEPRRRTTTRVRAGTRAARQSTSKRPTRSPKAPKTPKTPRP